MTKITRSNVFWAICEIDEDLILGVEPERTTRRKTRRPVRLVLIAAVVAVLLAGAALAVYQYTRITESLANRWEVLGDTEMPEAQKDYIEQKSSGIGTSVTDQSMTITLDSLTATETSIYLLFEIQPDVTIYGEIDPNVEYVIAPFDAEGSIENPNFGNVEVNHYGGNSEDIDGGYWESLILSFDDLPENARLNDGETSLHLSIHTLIQGIAGIGAPADSPTISGTWAFDVLLPSSAPATAITSSRQLEFSNEAVLHISDLMVDSKCASFNVQTEIGEYSFVDSGTQEALAHAAQPDAKFFTVTAKLDDGTAIPTGGIKEEKTQQANLDRWIIDWSAPMDPERIASLLFSDGINEIEVSLDP